MSLDFLRKVLPEGLIVLAKPASKGFIQVVCATVEEAAILAAQWDQQGKDVYFGLGSLLAPFQIRESDGKKEVRVGANIAQLKCLFLDLDIEAGNNKKYETQADAIIALRDFCRAESFPAPMIVNSGGGIHAYWPFDKPVPADQWRVLASTFKAALIACGLKADPTRTADASSVLRVVGTHNYKHGMKRPVELLKDVEPYARKEILLAVMQLAEKYNAVAAKSSTPKATSVLGSNTEKVYEPSDVKKIIEHCKQFAILAATGGDEPLWYAGLQVVRHVIDPEKAAILISQAHPNYNEAEMLTKLNQLDGKSIGPATCQQFCLTNAAGCEDCPHRGKITSPIQLGQALLRHVPVIIEEEDPVTGLMKETKVLEYPFPYFADEKGRISIKAKADAQGVAETVVIHDHEIRPLKRTHSERHGIESTTWTVKQPVEGWKDFTIEQSLLAKPEGLHGMLLSKGLYVTPGRAKPMVSFMIAYIKELQKDIATEQLFSKLGWRDENTKFVLGDMIYSRDGTSAQHQMSPEIKAEVPGLRSAGTLEGWKEAIQFYNAADHEAHRFLLYCGFGCPLLHMTGHKGVIVNGTGEPGAGKTTAVLVANSIYGHPVDLTFNGTRAGSTTNALYSALAAHNNIPFGMDEITRIDPKILGDFCLSVNQGTGKRVNTRSGMLSHNIPSWATMVLASANTDVYMALGQSRTDAAAEAMRVLQIPFVIPLTHTKTQADRFLQELKEHHGIAGQVFVQHVTEHYLVVWKQVTAIMALVDSKAGITSGERFWSGAIAAAFAGAMVARRLGLLDGFPIEQDFDWIVGQISSTRKTMIEHIASSKEIISEFLESRVGETLVVSQTLKANIAPRVDQAPRGALYIRHEVDADRVFIMKSEFKRYCQETGANYGAIQIDLESRAVLIDRNKQVVLGKGTDYGKGQVRCWEIDLGLLRA